MTCDTKEEKIADVELKINGKNVETNCFVQNFIAETLMGMVKCPSRTNDVGLFRNVMLDGLVC